MSKSVVCAFGIMFTCQFATLRCQGLMVSTLQGLLIQDRYNPSLADTARGLHWGIGSVSYNIFHTGPGYRDLIQSSGRGSVLLVSNLFKHLEDRNELATSLRWQTIKMHHAGPRWTFGFEHEIAFEAHTLYPRELVGLYVEGNQQWIGEDVQIAPSAMVLSYNSYGFPISRRFRKVSLGLRPRFLMGQQLGHTPRSSAVLYTDPDFYELTLNLDLQFENVGILNFDEANLLNYQTSDLSGWQFISSHPGFALDGGVQVALSKKMAVALSFSDLGFIRWSNVTVYEADHLVQYTGAETVDLFEIESLNLNNAIDSLDQIFNVERTTGMQTRNLPVKFHFLGIYKLSRNASLAASLSHQQLLEQPVHASMIFSHRLGERVRFGTALSYRYGQLGLGLSGQWQFGRFTGFLVTDHLMADHPFRSNHFHLRIGLECHLLD